MRPTLRRSRLSAHVTQPVSGSTSGVSPAVLWQIIGAFIALLGLAPTVARSGGLSYDRWKWAIVAVGGTVLLIGIALTVAPRVLQRTRARVSLRTLLRRWPDFLAKAKAYSEFFDYTLVFQLGSPIQTAEGLDLTKPEDAALNARREAAIAAIGFLARLTFELLDDLELQPRRIDRAQDLVKRFEAIASGPSVLSIECVYEALAPRSPRSEELSAGLSRLRAFKRDYEIFARAANEDLGVEFYRQHLP